MASKINYIIYSNDHRPFKVVYTLDLAFLITFSLTMLLFIMKNPFIFFWIV